MEEQDKTVLKEVYPVHERVRKIAYIKSREEYEKLYQRVHGRSVGLVGQAGR